MSPCTWKEKEKVKVQVVVGMKDHDVVLDPVGSICNAAHIIGRTLDGAKIGYRLGTAEVRTGAVNSSTLTKAEKKKIVEDAIEATLKLL
jgi:hypothetical protein